MGEVVYFSGFHLIAMCNDTDLVIVSAHGGGEGVSAAHAHPHAPAAVEPGPEEVCHPRPLLLGLGGQLPVPGLDPVLLHRQGSLNLGQSLVSVIQGQWCDW